MLLSVHVQGGGLFTGFTRLSKGLAVLLATGFLLTTLLLSSVEYLALIPGRYTVTLDILFFVSLVFFWVLVIITCSPKQEFCDLKSVCSFCTLTILVFMLSCWTPFCHNVALLRIAYGLLSCLLLNVHFVCADLFLLCGLSWQQAI